MAEAASAAPLTGRLVPVGATPAFCSTRRRRSPACSTWGQHMGVPAQRLTVCVVELCKPWPRASATRIAVALGNAATGVVQGSGVGTAAVACGNRSTEAHTARPAAHPGVGRNAVVAAGQCVAQAVVRGGVAGNTAGFATGPDAGCTASLSANLQKESLPEWPALLREPLRAGILQGQPQAAREGLEDQS